MVFPTPRVPRGPFLSSQSLPKPEPAPAPLPLPELLPLEGCPGRGGAGRGRGPGGGLGEAICVRALPLLPALDSCSVCPPALHRPRAQGPGQSQGCAPPSSEPGYPAIQERWPGWGSLGGTWGVGAASWLGDHGPCPCHPPLLGWAGLGSGGRSSSVWEGWESLSIRRPWFPQDPAPGTETSKRPTCQGLGPSRLPHPHRGPAGLGLRGELGGRGKWTPRPGFQNGGAWARDGPSAGPSRWTSPDLGSPGHEGWRASGHRASPRAEGPRRAARRPPRARARPSPPPAAPPTHEPRRRRHGLMGDGGRRRSVLPERDPGRRVRVRAQQPRGAAAQVLAAPGADGQAAALAELEQEVLGALAVAAHAAVAAGVPEPAAAACGAPGGRRPAARAPSPPPQPRRRRPPRGPPRIW